MEREAVEEIKRHFGVVAEHLEGKIQLLAEGQEVLRREFQEFREEVRAEFREVKAMGSLAPSLPQRDEPSRCEGNGRKSRCRGCPSPRLEEGAVGVESGGVSPGIRSPIKGLYAAYTPPRDAERPKGLDFA
jgi:hypothetical protein